MTTRTPPVLRGPVSPSSRGWRRALPGFGLRVPSALQGCLSDPQQRACCELLSNPGWWHPLSTSCVSILSLSSFMCPRESDVGGDVWLALVLAGAGGRGLQAVLTSVTRWRQGPREGRARPGALTRCIHSAAPSLQEVNTTLHLQMHELGRAGRCWKRCPQAFAFAVGRGSHKWVPGPNCATPSL